MRRLTLIGNVGNSATIKQVNNKMVANFGVCINENYYDNAGNKTEKKVWYDCSLWFETTNKTDYSLLLNKGNHLYIEGIPGVHTYMKDGQPVGVMTCNVQYFKVLQYKNAQEGVDNAGN